MITTTQGTSVKLSTDRLVFVSRNHTNFYAVGEVMADGRFIHTTRNGLGPDVLRAIADLIDGLSE